MSEQTLPRLAITSTFQKDIPKQPQVDSELMYTDRSYNTDGVSNYPCIYTFSPYPEVCPYKIQGHRASCVHRYTR